MGPRRKLIPALFITLLVIGLGSGVISTSPWIAGGLPGTITPINPGGGGGTAGQAVPAMMGSTSTTTVLPYGFQHGQFDSANGGRLIEQWFLADETVEDATGAEIMQEFPDRLPVATRRHSHEDGFSLTMGVLGSSPAAQMTAFEFYNAGKAKFTSGLAGNGRYAIGSTVPVIGMPPVPTASGISVNTKGLREEYSLPGAKPCTWSVFALEAESLPSGNKFKVRGFEKRRNFLQAFGGKQCDATVPIVAADATVLTSTGGPERVTYGTWLNTITVWCTGTCYSAEGKLLIDTDGTHQAWVDQAEIEANLP